MPLPSMSFLEETCQSLKEIVPYPRELTFHYRLAAAAIELPTMKSHGDTLEAPAIRSRGRGGHRASPVPSARGRTTSAPPGSTGTRVLRQSTVDATKHSREASGSPAGSAGGSRASSVAGKRSRPDDNDDMEDAKKPRLNETAVPRRLDNLSQCALYAAEKLMSKHSMTFTTGTLVKGVSEQMFLTLEV